MQLWIGFATQRVLADNVRRPLAFSFTRWLCIALSPIPSNGGNRELTPQKRARAGKQDSGNRVGFPEPNIRFPLLIEIPQDTARAVTNLLFTGAFARLQDIRFIFTHAGGNMPILLGRKHQYSPKNICEMASTESTSNCDNALARSYRN